MLHNACQRTGTLLVLNSLLTAISFAQSPAAPAVRPAPIMSRWEKQVTADNAWREYPRPQLVRQQWQNLNGMWEYAITPKTAPVPTQFTGAPDRGQILVPFAVESTLSKVTKPLTPDQRLWYRRSVTVPRDWNGQRVLLHFGAVDYECSLWVNGGLVGSHTGGSDAFSFDITDYLKDGQNQVLLGVTDPTSTGEQPRGKQLLNPNSIWYTPVSGIWQTVWMEPVPKAHHIDEIRLTPEVDSGRVRVEVLLDKPVTGPTTAIRLTALDGNQTVATTITRADRVAYLPIQNPKLWSPDSPFLYNFRAELVTVNDPFAGTANDKRPRRNDAERAAYAKATVAGTATDAVTSYFAMRKIAMGPNPAGSGSAANQPVLLLNNKFVFQNGPLDQGWWPGGLLTPPSDEAMAFEIDFLKKSGFNMLRKHIKVEPDRYYYLCDKLGILVWQDMPSGFLEGQNESPGDQFEPIRRSKGVEQFELELRRMMNQLHNHPSIVTWVVHNEGWGQYDNPRLSAWVKGLDPSRTVNAVSGWNDRNAGDFYDIHTYEPEPRFPAPKSDRVVVIGEFGGIGWPIQGHLWNPEMRNWGYQTYHSAAEVEKAYRTKYAKIADYYKNRALSAAVYTQTTDVEGEVNGLLTYDREVIKIPVETLRQIHAPLFDK